MQNAGRKQNAAVTMAFLFVSLVLTPLSLKAIGISPNLSAGVEAWRRIAGIFTNSHQPVNAAELLALNAIPEDVPAVEATPVASGLLASTQPLGMQLTAELPASAIDCISSNPAAAPLASRRAKSSRPARPAAPTAPMAVMPVISVKGIAAEPFSSEAASVVVPIRRAVVQRYERAMASYRFQLDEAMKFVPKGLNVQVKVKAPKPTTLPKYTTCDYRNVFSPEKIKQLRTAGWPLPSEDGSEFTEKSEL